MKNRWLLVLLLMFALILVACSPSTPAEEPAVEEPAAEEPAAEEPAAEEPAAEEPAAEPEQFRVAVVMPSAINDPAF